MSAPESKRVTLADLLNSPIVNQFGPPFLLAWAVIQVIDFFYPLPQPVKIGLFAALLVALFIILWAANHQIVVKRAAGATLSWASFVFAGSVLIAICVLIISVYITIGSGLYTGIGTALHDNLYRTSCGYANTWPFISPLRCYAVPRYSYSDALYNAYPFIFGVAYYVLLPFSIVRGMWTSAKS